ncbi:MAG: DUF2225 domain-containing protein [Bacillus sp. (in: Bacteria)]|nr:DUF2225 domain-containing protein [Bacillus sp. (in: firmicutes)]MCM1427927.1 DUF2225 domain-containing protein [Eubacterium sp.]
MADLLSGLEQFGLGNLKNMNLYDEPKKAEGDDKSPAAAAPVMQEQDYLFDKATTCPICDKEFKTKTVKVGKVKLSGTDLDLRPKYDQVDLIKYDIIMCPHCGYAALSRFFKFVTSPQAKHIKESISSAFKPQTEVKEIFTYDDALERYQLTLANAIVKQAKPSEKAYICLKTAWLLRGKGEHMDTSAPDYAEEKKKLDEEENEFLHNALEGFLSARQTESFPMCGMDEPTVDYLIAVLSMRFEQYDVATRLVSGILTNPSANPRMKDKARMIKEMLVKKIKEKNAAKK